MRIQTEVLTVDFTVDVFAVWLKLRKRLSSLLGVCNNLGATVFSTDPVERGGLQPYRD